LIRRVLSDVDWDRLEAEFADVDAESGVGPPLADRILAVIDQRHARRAVVVALAAVMLVAAITVSVLVVVLPDRVPAGPGAGFRAAVVVNPEFVTHAQIYAAALSGGVAAPQSVRRVWVSDRICRAIPTSLTASACTDARIPPSVQRQVIALLGPRVRFAATSPPRPSPDAPVVRFGGLVVHGERAELGMETRCGPLCAEGQTLVLRERNGQWRVSGSVGPSWVS
jgi:hypothetical protein